VTHSIARPNAQLRRLNVHMRSIVGKSLISFPTSCQHAGHAHSIRKFGGVNSFGYSGTIAHAIVSSNSYSNCLVYDLRKFCQKAYNWPRSTTAIAKSSCVAIKHKDTKENADTFEDLGQFVGMCAGVAGCALDEDSLLADILDSLASEELRNMLQQYFSHPLPPSIIFDHPTPKLLQQFISTLVQDGVKNVQEVESINSRLAAIGASSAQGSGTKRISTTLMQFHIGDATKVPLFGVPAITGSGVYVNGLRSCNHPIYATEEEYLNTGNNQHLKIASVSHLGTKHAMVMVAECVAISHTKFHVVGGSFGGILAHQVALVSQQSGEFAHKLILLDPLPPAPWANFRDAKLTQRYAAKFMMRLALLDDWETSASSLEQAPETELHVRVAEQLMKSGRRPFSVDSIVQAGREIDLICYYYRLLRDHVLPPCDGPEYTPWLAGIFMVVVTGRIQFFTSVYQLSEQESSAEHARLFGDVDHEILLDGGHIEVIARIAAGRDECFTQNFHQYLLQVE